ncbi:MAG: hypothetical protein EOO73_05295 [Myxococcales bacterium]|nr:MAG: hypothetical protein EOO73_05295 [Myxococcales bacterium]
MEISAGWSAPAELAEPPAELRARAKAVDAVSATELDLAVLWQELVCGACEVIDYFFTDERCLLLTKPRVAPGRAIEGRRLAIVQAVLCGGGQKAVAIELGLAASTITMHARLALSALGVDGKPSRAHPILMLAARSAADASAALGANLSFIEQSGGQLRVLSLSRPDAALGGVLPPAELAVARRLVEGHCYADMARMRGTSARTIANQIAAVFKRMRVSGRNELVHRLWRRRAAAGVPSRANVRYLTRVQGVSRGLSLG